jgi:hypothetical protein
MGGELVAQAVLARRRTQLVSGLRGLARAPAPAKEANGGRADAARGVAPLELCELCGTSVPADHRHLLNLHERTIVCVCESCWALRSGEAEYRPTGARTLWLGDLRVPDDVWAGFRIPIGLAFFMESTVAGCVVALYPSPAGATESELHFSSWSRMVELNPVLEHLEPDIEGLIVNRLSEPAEYAIAPIDRCYALTGAVKASWQGISGGADVEAAVSDFFARMRVEAGTA